MLPDGQHWLYCLVGSFKGYHWISIFLIFLRYYHEVVVCSKTQLDEEVRNIFGFVFQIFSKAFEFH